MPNFMKVLRQIKKFPIPALDSDCSFFMVAICYSGPISAIPTNEQLLGERRMGVKFQIDIRQTDGRCSGHKYMEKRIN